MDLQVKIKRRLGIPEANTDFDDDLSDYIEESIDALMPIVQRELAPQTVTLASGDNTIDLTALAGDVRSVRLLEIYDTANQQYGSFDEYTQHENTIYLQTSFDESKTINVWGFAPYTQATLPRELAGVVINWAMSEFYSNLVGNSRKYNLYTQSSGARKTDNMRDTSDYYWSRGNQLLVDRATVRGLA